MTRNIHPYDHIFIGGKQIHVECGNTGFKTYQAGLHHVGFGETFDSEVAELGFACMPMNAELKEIAQDIANAKKYVRQLRAIVTTF